MTNSNLIRIYVAGHLGMVGSAITRILKATDGVEVVTRTRKELDLTSQEQGRPVRRRNRAGC